MNHLKNAEQKASELVSAAKNSKSQFSSMIGDKNDSWHLFLCAVDRTSQIRQAKVEAEAEIARYKAEQEAAYQAALAKVRLPFHSLLFPPLILSADHLSLIVDYTSGSWWSWW